MWLWTLWLACSDPASQRGAADSSRTGETGTAGTEPTGTTPVGTASTGETGSPGATSSTASTGATGATGDTGHPPFEYDDRGCVTNASRSTESMYLDILLNESNTPGDEGWLEEFFFVSMALYKNTVVVSDTVDHTPIAAGPGDLCEWTEGLVTIDGELVDAGTVHIDIGPHQLEFPYMPPGARSSPAASEYEGYIGYTGEGEGYHAYESSGFPPAIDAYFGHDVVVTVEGSAQLDGFTLTGQTPPRRFDITQPVHQSIVDPESLVYRWVPGTSLHGRLRVVLSADWLGRTMACTIEDDGDWSLPEEFVDELDPQLIGVTAWFYSQPPCIHDIGDGRTAFANIVRHNESRRVYLDMSN